MNKKMIMAGLAARPVRTTVSILAVALEVTLILVVVGLTSGISYETGKRTEGVGADIMFQPPNSSLILAINNSTMPIALENKIKEVEGVKAVAPVQTLVNSSSGLEIIYGIDPQKFDAVTGGFIWHKGGYFKATDEIVVDDVYAHPAGYGAIDTWAAVLGFSGQIYFDFAGYSLCAIGLALCFIGSYTFFLPCLQVATNGPVDFKPHHYP